MLGAQLLLPPSAPPAEPPGLAARRQRPVMIPPAPEYAAILAAPIFAPDRHPAAGGEAVEGGGGSLAGYAAVGGVAGGGVGTAVITAPGGALKTVRLGETVEGWRLVAIDPRQVVFLRNGVRHALVIGAPAEAAAAQGSANADAATPQADSQ